MNRADKLENALNNINMKKEQLAARNYDIFHNIKKVNKHKTEEAELYRTYVKKSKFTNNNTDSANFMFKREELPNEKHNLTDETKFPELNMQNTVNINNDNIWNTLKTGNIISELKEMKTNSVKIPIKPLTKKTNSDQINKKNVSSSNEKINILDDITEIYTDLLNNKKLPQQKEIVNKDKNGFTKVTKQQNNNRSYY